MTNRQTERGPHFIASGSAGGGCAKRFSVCLFIVILAVCAWTMHRRLAQYDSIQQAGHHSTAIKVCLTERTQVPAPAIHGIDSFTLLFEVLAFAVALFTLGNSEASLMLRVLRNASTMFCSARTGRALIHFFFLPPPSLSTAS